MYELLYNLPPRPLAYTLTILGDNLVIVVIIVVVVVTVVVVGLSVYTHVMYIY